MNVWEQIKQRLSVQISTESFQNWFASTRFRQFDGGTLFVSVPSDASRAWLEEEYGKLVRQTIQDLNLPIRRMVYEPEGIVNQANRPSLQEIGSSLTDGLFATPASQLNPKFSFDNFVVGPCNQFAHAAARAVSDTPSRRYNPLFIWGDVGMGKTHLMHSIGRSLLDRYAGMRIVYTSSERFMNEMINCIKLDRLPLFHQHYRSADVLLVDDIQILSGKERTQDEFFYTFNELFDHQKQIVISSDSSPKEIKGLVERLRSRFEWGLMVDVQAPDLETKMAILDRKAEEKGVTLPESVRVFIATKTKSNIRELEGALVKLIAYADMNKCPITLPMAQHLLKHLGQNQERRITIESIIKAAADHFGLTPAQLKQKSNAQKIAYPRQVAMYLIKELTPASLPEIGRTFAGKHHTTVLHSIQKIEELRKHDPDLNRLIHRLMDSLQA